jgi:type IV pilus assembly protein PilB
VCAFVNKPSEQTIHELRFLTDLIIHPVVVPSTTIEEAIFCAYHRESESLTTLIEQMKNSKVTSPLKEELDWKPKDSSVASLLSGLIEHALAINVSDIHLVPLRDNLTIQMRKNGALLTRREEVSPHFKEELVRRIRVLCKISSHGREGSFRVPLEGISASVRVSIVPNLHGEKVVLRLLTNHTSAEISALGLHHDVLSRLSEFGKLSEGVLIVGGATGSGKTTTLYSLASYLSSKGCSVSSVEDPIERELPTISQTPAGEMSYSEALKLLLRQDPDVIMVGELRDQESAQLFFQGASTGHLMISSIHGGSLSSMLQRLLDLGVTAELLYHTTPHLLYQQLLPKLCPACRVFKLATNKYYCPGCASCDYSGIAERLLFSQYLVLTPDLLASYSTGEIVKNARKIGALVGTSETEYEELRRNGIVGSLL